MPAMNCPACGSDMRGRSLLSQYSFRPYRVCPDCGSKYTVDSTTKKRQFVILALALSAFALTAAVYFRGVTWLAPLVLAHIVFWIYLGYVISKITYVPYGD